MRKLLLFLNLLFPSIISFAQSNPVFCGTDDRYQQWLDADPEHRQADSDREAQLQKSIQDHWLSAGQRGDEVFTIPVVVHVVWRTPEAQISDLRIRSQIAVLNEDFRKKNRDLAGVPDEFRVQAADAGLEFCLASLDPEGRSTTGITRTQTSVETVGTARDFLTNRTIIHRTALGGQDAWDPDRYLNIWLGSMPEGMLGFASIPGTAPPEEDGIVIDPRYFGISCRADKAVYPHHLGRTATHEIGHYFNLFHPWRGGCADPDNDFVADTPPQSGAHTGCPPYPQRSCNSSDMFPNFMQFTDDACMGMFSAGQAERMLAALHELRPGLLESDGCGGMIAPPPSEMEILAYPNPATDCLHVRSQLDTTKETLSIELLDSAGRRLYRATENTGLIHSIDLTSFSTGVYFLHVLIGSRSVTKRVVVAK